MKQGFSFKGFFIRTAIIFAGSCLIAVAVNAARPTPLNWVASSIYEIFQDCPESTASAEKTTISSILESRNKYLVIDTRQADEIKANPIDNSIAIEYDSLFPIEESSIAKIRKESTGKSVLVVGKGSTAKLMADELVSKGLKNIFYLSKSSNLNQLVNKEEAL